MTLTFDNEFDDIIKRRLMVTVNAEETRPPSQQRQPRSRRELRDDSRLMNSEPGEVWAPVSGSEQPPTVTNGSGRFRRRRWGCLIVVVVLLGLGTVGYFFAQGQISSLAAKVFGSEDYQGNGETQVRVTIKPGDIGGDIARALKDLDVVKSAEAFYQLLLKTKPEPKFQAGVYLVKTKSSAVSALSALQDPANLAVLSYTVPEGKSMKDTFEIIANAVGSGVKVADLEVAAANLQTFGLPAEAKTVEGFLFPAKYTFNLGADAATVVKTMVDRTFQSLDKLGIPVDQRWRVIVLASIVQREAGKNVADFDKVSRVFQNRLDRGINLESDATVAYGTGNIHTVWTTDAERKDKSNLYNTYANPGLPVGPISNPGDIAIKAAFNPTPGNWLFFAPINLDTGETVFSDTLAGHEAAVTKLRAWCAESPERDKKYCR